MEIDIILQPTFSLKWPKVKIFFNEKMIYDNYCKPNDKDFFRYKYNADPKLISHTNKIKIEHYDKQGEETVVDKNGETISDRAIILKSISIDGLEIPEVVLFDQPFNVILTERQKRQKNHIPNTIKNNLYFGYNGFYEYELCDDATKHYFETLIIKEKLSNIANTKTISLPNGTIVESFEFSGRQLDGTKKTKITIDDLYEQIKNEI